MMTKDEFDLYYYTEEQMAAKLKRKVKTLRNWYAKGKGPPRTPEGFYPVEGFKKWNDLRANRNNVKAGAA